MDKLIIFGEDSGYFQELADIADDLNLEYVSHFSPESAKNEGTIESGTFLVAIGNPKLRKKIFEEAIKLGWRPNKAVIHTIVSVSQSATIGEGSHINRLTAIASNVVIGENCQINRSCNIGHNAQIGNHVSFGPGVTVCGNVQIGDECLIGAGAVLLPGVKIGRDAIVGAGSVVTKDVESGKTVLGNPARRPD